MPNNHLALHAIIILASMSIHLVDAKSFGPMTQSRVATTFLFLIITLLFQSEPTVAQREKREHNIPSDDGQDHLMGTGTGDALRRKHHGGHHTPRGRLRWEIIVFSYICQLTFIFRCLVIPFSLSCCRFRGDPDPNAGADVERAMQEEFQEKQLMIKPPSTSRQPSHTSYGTLISNNRPYTLPSHPLWFYADTFVFFLLV